MTKWGMLLLCAYIALGATTRLSVRQAGGAALALTVVVVAVALIGYSSSTPRDRYIPNFDSTVYLTGNTMQQSADPTSTEDHAGATPATWTSTDHRPGAISGTDPGGQ